MPNEPGHNFTESVARPPISLQPRWLWLEHRTLELEAAMQRYAAAQKDIPHEWITEYLEHRKTIWQLTGKEDQRGNR